MFREAELLRFTDRNHKITCCGVELSKDILKIFAEKIEIIEQDTKNSQNTFEQMVELVYFNDNDCARVRELLKKSNGNIADDKIDEIIACLSSHQGITCFYYSSVQGYQSYLKNTSQDVSELLSKSLDDAISSISGLKNSGNTFFGLAICKCCFSHRTDCLLQLTLSRADITTRSTFHAFQAFVFRKCFFIMMFRIICKS